MTNALRVGDRIRDNDPRMRGRVLEVTHISAISGVQAKNKAGRLRWYRIDRIYTDDKPRKSGFSLLKDPQ